MLVVLLFQQLMKWMLDLNHFYIMTAESATYFHNFSLFCSVNSKMHEANSVHYGTRALCKFDKCRGEGTHLILRQLKSRLWFLIKMSN